MSLEHRLNSSQLKSFSINGLFGFKDVKINFDKEAVILIAENGSGKTTILNALYYSISCEFSKLKRIYFDSIILEFASGDTVEIRKDDLNALRQSDFSSQGNYIDAFNVSAQQLMEMLQREFRGGSSSGVGLKARSGSKGEEQQGKIDKIRATIQENMHESILYFPTYRRVEEDLKNLGYEEEEKSEGFSFGQGDGKLIQFGMKDVSNKFDEITTTIKNSALNLFSKVTGEILTQFVEGIHITQEMRDSIKPDTLNIVLSRVGEENISTSDRERIENLVSSGEINSEKHNQLVYFLSKLVGLYEQQKEKDESINQFASVCNNYLNEKRIVYDEANVEISIIQTRNNSPIDIKDLSSGEKQIISLFSKIYLESSEDFILLFDEPELSLAIEWQRLLLPDILRSGKCRLLLAVTHSPFIFDNELDSYANDLDIFVREEQ
ncbi:MAG: AAA family ATPase [Oscillatoria sp. SIO1A7]|nr:AAA family ATPase [Oscillatoria sp. SIO1A7]